MQNKNKNSESIKVKVMSFVWILFLIFNVLLSTTSAQTLYVNENNGMQTAYDLCNLRKMSFTSENLTILKTDNSSGVYPLNNLRNLSFSKTSGFNEQRLIQEPLIAYPNPVTNVLSIELSGDVHQDGRLSLFNIEGKAIINRQVRNEGVISLDVRFLPKGIYLLRYSNSAEIKTVKIVKQ